MLLLRTVFQLVLLFGNAGFALCVRRQGHVSEIRYKIKRNELGQRFCDSVSDPSQRPCLHHKRDTLPLSAENPLGGA